MPQSPVDTSKVRTILKVARRRTGLTQEAAAKLAGISEAWWRRIENGVVPTATAGTVAAMCHSAGLSAEFVRKRGLEHVAELMDDLQEMDKPALPEPEPTDDEALERYLMKSPADMETRVALVGFLRSLRAVQHESRDEPLLEELWRTRRRLAAASQP